MTDKTHGLTCPECSGVVPVREGQRIVTCPYCGLNSMLQGDRGIRRWQVSRRVERAQAEKAVQGFFSGIKKARDLKKQAKISDMFLIYLPYWRVHADVGGWRFGRVKAGEDSTKPVEVEIMEEMHWTDAALDVSEYGVHRITLSKEQLEPFDSEVLHAEAIVFDPAESHSEALTEAHDHFIYRARRKKNLKTTHFEKFHYFHERLSIVYYPLWVSRYSYHKRNYQVVVDGVTGETLYGKAPGNIMYRAAALVGGMAAGNFILVNGTIAAGWIIGSSSDDDGLAILLLPIAIGAGLIFAGYRAFRYGEEVEEIEGKVKKARGKHGRAKSLFESVSGGNMEDLMKTGMDLLEDMSKSR